MKIGATICFVLAALTLAVAVMNTAKGPPRDPTLPQEEQTAQVVGYVVGSLLFPVIFLIAGFVLRRIAAGKDAPIVATLVDEPPRSRPN